MTGSFVHPFPAGAQLVDTERTRFRLWAPAASSVVLEIDGKADSRMPPTRDGWFETEVHCGAGSRYRYRLEDGTRVPDPASRFQAGDVHDWSMVLDPAAHCWQHPQWSGRPWCETVIYELHAGVLGGYRAIIPQLPRLAGLGVTALELMPIADFPGPRNWGYDGVLPYAPDAAYGTPDELKSLIDAAHGAGLMVFLDVVYNHFGPDGNYLHLYSPQFFTAEHHTAWGAAIDFHRPQVREFFLHNALYWLMEYRFDGLRFDAVHAIVDRSWLDEAAVQIRRRVEPGRHVHLMLENELNEASHLEAGFDAQWNDDIHNALHVLMTGEREGYYALYQERPATLLARALAEGFIRQGQPLAGAEGHARGTPSAHLPPTAFIFFLQNHDQVGNRAVGEHLRVLVPPATLAAAVALQLLSPQIPLLFMGEESGSGTPFFYFTSHHAELAEAVRDGRRREFAKFAAFSDPAARESIPDPNDPATFDRSRPRQDDESEAYEARYRELLSLRRQHLVPRLPGSRSLGASAIGVAAVIARWRLGDGALLTIAVNFDTAPVTLPPLHAPVLHQSRGEISAALQRGQLPEQAACVFLEPAH